MKEHVYFVYILASRRNGTLYTGVTNDVLHRTWQHKNDLVAEFARSTACTLILPRLGGRWIGAAAPRRRGDCNTPSASLRASLARHLSRKRARISIREALSREKQIKGWNRAWKIKLIEKNNSGWNDLHERLAGSIALPESPGSLCVRRVAE